MGTGCLTVVEGQSFFCDLSVIFLTQRLQNITCTGMANIAQCFKGFVLHFKTAL